MSQILPEPNPSSAALPPALHTEQKEKALLAGRKNTPTAQELTPEEQEIIVAQLQVMKDTLQTHGLTTEEKNVLASQIALAIQLPNLSPPVHELLTQFAAALGTAPPPTELNPQNLSVHINNVWLTTSAAVYLFISMQGIISILAKMKYAQATLQINISNQQIDIAKQLKDIAEQQGNLAADLCIQDAHKALLDAGCAIGQLVMTSVTMMYRFSETGKMTQKLTQEKADTLHVPKNQVTISMKEKLEIESHVDTKVRTLSQFSESLFGAVRGTGEARIAYMKAELERLKGQTEGSKILIEKLSQILESSLRQVQSGREDIDQLLSKYMDLMRSVLQAVGEVFSV